MKTLALSFVMTMLSLVINTVVYIRIPLVVGAIVLAIVMAFPATSYAAVIQCNASGCPLVSWWDLLPWTKKAGIFLFFSGLIIGNVIMWHDKKVTTERIKKEEKEWLKKYHS